MVFFDVIRDVEDVFDVESVGFVDDDNFGDDLFGEIDKVIV